MIPFYVDSDSIKEEDIFQNKQRKEEIVKIITQTLDNLGYTSAAQSLISESGIHQENEQLRKFRQSILMGQWQKVLEQLNQLELSLEQIHKIKILIFEEQYLEYLVTRNINEAINVLRNCIQGICQDTQYLHKLAGLITCNTQEEINKVYQWPGANLQARKKLLQNIKNICKFNDLIEQNKMEKILKQAISYQKLSCKYHIDDNLDFSLIENHQCKLEQAPSKCIQALKYCQDEVWIVKFSNNGQFLASIEKNQTLTIFNFDINKLNTTIKFQLKKVHEKEIQCINWNPNDELILTASADCTIKVWNIKTQLLQLHLKGHQSMVSAAIWHPIYNQIISAGIDKFLIVWNGQTGSKLSEIKSTKVQDLFITKDGQQIFTVCADQNKIKIYDFNKKTELQSIQEKDTIVSTVLSSDEKLLFVNVSYKNPEIHLWKLDTFEQINIYEGHVQQKFTLRCSLGGQINEFLACGSEDGKILFWHRNQTKPIQVIQGHKMTVNCVSFNKKVPDVLASGSDDFKIKIWVTKDRFNQIKQMNQKRLQLYQQQLTSTNDLFIMEENKDKIQLIESQNQNQSEIEEESQFQSSMQSQLINIISQRNLFEQNDEDEDDSDYDY